MMKKNLFYSLLALSLTTFVASSCAPVDGDDHSLGGVVISQEPVLTVNQVSEKEFTLINSSGAIDGVTYFFCTDGKKLEKAPVGASITFKVKKNGVYPLTLYAFSGRDQKVAKYDLVVDWFKDGDDAQWLGFQHGDNLLAGTTPSTRTWYADGGWSELANQPTVDGDIQSYEFTVPAGVGGDQWQAQVHVEGTGVKLSSGKKYDVSVAIVSNANFEGDGATFKPQLSGNDDVFLCADRHPIKAGVNVIALSDVAGFDGELKFAFDFAGAPVGTEIAIKKLFVTEHQAANVAIFAAAPLAFFDYSSEDNLLQGKEATDITTWFANNDWAELGSQPAVEGNAALYELTVPEGTGGSQWQGQVHLPFKDVRLSSGKKYDFSVVIVADKNLPNMTFKPQQDGNDDSYLALEQRNVTANVPFAFQVSGVDGFDGPFQLCLDFGGAEAGANIQIVGIYVGEHK